MTLPTSIQAMTEYLHQRGAYAVSTSVGPILGTQPPVAQVNAGVSMPDGRAANRTGTTAPSLDLQAGEALAVELLTQAAREVGLIP